ncbi:hypothetical protein MRX96_012142 [Rhipicephalus microplus]
MLTPTFLVQIAWQAHLAVGSTGLGFVRSALLGQAFVRASSDCHAPEDREHAQKDFATAAPQWIHHEPAPYLSQAYHRIDSVTSYSVDNFKHKYRGLLEDPFSGLGDTAGRWMLTPIFFFQIIWQAHLAVGSTGLGFVRPAPLGHAFVRASSDCHAPEDRDHAQKDFATAAPQWIHHEPAPYLSQAYHRIDSVTSYSVDNFKHKYRGSWRILSVGLATLLADGCLRRFSYSRSLGRRISPLDQLALSSRGLHPLAMPSYGLHLTVTCRRTGSMRRRTSPLQYHHDFITNLRPT